MGDVISNTGGDKTDAFIVKIRDQYFHIEMFLYNQIDGYEPFPIPYLFVDSFSIEESLMNWITKGWIVISTDFEVLERGSTASVPDNVAQQIADSKPSYLFRTDGRNRLSIRLFPLAKNNEDGSVNPQSDEYPKDSWEICYDFVIYDVEDLPTKSNQKKLRKYYFWDERYQILSERNIEYSTAYTAQNSLAINGINNSVPITTNSNIKPSTLPDIKRSVNANIALQDIIRTASSTPPVMKNVIGKSKIKVGFKDLSDGGSINNPTEPMDAFDAENWEVGDNNNLLFYTSPSNATVIDDINYVLGYCMSNDKGPVFLDFGRSTNDKTWKLFGLSSLFKKSNDIQIERLIIEDSVINKNPPIERASTTPKGNIVNFMSPVASRITSYSFAPMVAMDDARITNAPVHNFDFSTGSFKILFNQNKAKDVRDQMQTYGKLGLYNFLPKNPNYNNSQILLNLNQTKTKGINLTNNFVPQRFFPTNISQLQMMKDALFLNQAISFRVQGLTLRTPGKFLFIDRLGYDGKLNPFDDRFLGQWLIINVNHVFTQSSYLTDVVAVKVDSFSKLWTQTETKD